MACTSEDLFRSLVEHALRCVEAAAAELGGPEPDVSAVREGGWTRVQELGHLWDSAQVNHLRLLRGLEAEDLVFPGYDQDAWVRAQRLDELPWPRLVEGWRADNWRLLHLLERIEPARRARPRHPHSLDRIAWQPFSAAEPASLEDLARDYIGHLQHHLRRVCPAALPPIQLPAGLGRARLPLATERLELRPLGEGDLDELAPILADPEVVRFLPVPPRNREQTARIIAHFAAHQERHGFSAWAVRERAGGALAGWCGLAELDATGEVELLYCLGRHAWGRGLAGEAALACVEQARGALGLPRLLAVVDPANLASRRVLEKCGLAQRRRRRHFGMELEEWRLDFHA
jgi:ribosomal-protein-alanine N-acetyltransferase